MFEPNVNCNSQTLHNILVTRFEQQTSLTRKKSEPVLSITYEYDNIFDREYRQIEHFLYSKDESLTSFYVVDFSKGQTPSAVSDGGDWTVSIDNTRLYSSTTNYKANRAFLWNGRSWKEGVITTVTSNTSIVVDVDTYEYGDLTATDALADGLVYPMYEVYAGQGVLSNFKTTAHIDETVNTGADGGWMRSGNITFISKYKV